jgi:uncharacterized membrane protein
LRRYLLVTSVSVTVSDTYTAIASPPPTPPSPPPSPPPPASVTVDGTITLDGYTAATFGATQQTAFKGAIAGLVGVSVDSVTVAVVDARRRLLAGVVVSYSIATTDTASAATISTSISATSDVWPGRFCSPRHRMPAHLNQQNEGSENWNALDGGRYLRDPSLRRSSWRD